MGVVELRGAVSAAFGVELPATALFDYPNLASLAAHLAELLPGSAHAVARSVQLPIGLALSASGSEACGGSVTALVAASARYPSPSTWSSAAAGADAAAASLTAGAGNADLAGFAAAMAAGANIQGPVPPQRWDIDACYHPGACGSGHGVVG